VLDDRAHAGLAVAQADHAVTLAFKDARQQVALCGLVLDNQHQWRLFRALERRDRDHRVRRVAVAAREVHSPLPCSARIG
jgi:hypothetical protein